MPETLVPCLGETFDAYSARLGAPLQTLVLAGVLLRRFRWRGTVISVLFTAGHSVALHCAYPATRLDRQALPALLFSLHAADPWGTTVYCGATGALLVSSGCPQGVLAALDSEDGSTRPRVVRECLDLRDTSG
jgi:hypothetical protein